MEGNLRPLPYQQREVWRVSSIPVIYRDRGINGSEEDYGYVFWDRFFFVKSSGRITA